MQHTHFPTTPRSERAPRGYGRVLQKTHE
jgi:hypothetical protein